MSDGDAAPDTQNPAGDTTSDATASSFSDIGVSAEICDALAAAGITAPFPIQTLCIPLALEGNDLIGQAKTGTGKTLGFGIPLLQRIELGQSAPQALVVVPTRELCIQVADDLQLAGSTQGIKVLSVYGGRAYEPQVQALANGIDVVVGTPGRVLDLARQRKLDLSQVKILVLDEADEMLDMGFAEDLEAILDATPDERQTALFSATLPPRIAAIAARHLQDPETIKIDREPVSAGKAAKVRQVAYIVPRAHKMAALGRVLDIEHPTSAIVFCRTRTEVDELTETLNARGYRAEALHGGLSQEQRDRVMKKFRANKVDLLVATDVAARGLDVQHVSHVVNYDVPSASESYVHRIGRTGRAGREGVAITLAEPREHRLLRNIEFLTKQKIEIAQVPTVADLRARRLEMTRASLRETILGGELDAYRGIVESLAEEFDLMDVAAAAVKQVESRDGAAEEEEEIPAAAPRRERPIEGRAQGAAGRKRGHDRGGEIEERAARPRSRTVDGEGAASRREPFAASRDKRGRTRESAWDVARLYIGAGRSAKVRPGDLVGAIANEAGIDARAIGAIQIADRFSIVEVPEEIADDIVNALRSSTIKGRQVLVRRDRA